MYFSAIKSARYERKFAIPNLSVESLIALVQSHPLGFHEVYSPRYINNLYFDSFEAKCFSANIHGAARRYKCRLRWYGDLLKVTSPRLEYKMKIGHTGLKQVFSLPQLSFGDDSPLSLITDDIKQQLPEKHSELFRLNDLPVLLNRYFRHYFVSFNGLFRLTIDSELKFFSQKESPDINMSRCIENTAPLIMELKYALKDDFRSKSVTSLFPFRFSRSSKYVSGFKLIHGAQLSEPALVT